jgi:hypothetical protein
VRSLDRAVQQTLDVIEAGCEGIFTWSAIVEAVDDDLERRAAVCDETDFAMLFRLAVINGESGTLVILHAGLRAEAAQLASADDRLIAAIREGQIDVE